MEDSDINSCLPEGFACLFFRSIVFWVALIAIFIVGSIASHSYYVGVTNYRPKFPIGEGTLMWLYVIALLLGLLIPAVTIDMRGKMCHRKGMAFAFIIIILAITIGSLAIGSDMPTYGFTAYVVAIVMLVWLGYIAFKIDKSIWARASPFLVIIPIILLLGLGTLILRFGVVMV